MKARIYSLALFFKQTVIGRDSLTVTLVAKKMEEKLVVAVSDYPKPYSISNRHYQQRHKSLLIGADWLDTECCW